LASNSRSALLAFAANPAFPTSPAWLPLVARRSRKTTCLPSKGYPLRSGLDRRQSEFFVNWNFTQEMNYRAL